MKKKRRRNFVIILVLSIAIVIAIISTVKYVNYHNSYEYKLLEVGYNIKESTKIIKIFDSNKIETILKMKYQKNLIAIISSKYFIWNNLNKYLDYYKNNTTKDPKTFISIVNVGADKEWYKGAVKTDATKKYAILVNKYHYLTKDTKIDDIVAMSNRYSYDGNSIRQDVYDAYIKMFKAAKEEGLAIIANSSYRSYADQEGVYNKYVDNEGKDYADSFAARAGYSEHQTGLALDIFAKGYVKATFVQSPEAKWLAQNAYLYGFILRYPEGKEYLTGYSYEPWHYRYLGEALAKKVYNSGLTYDEYYAYYLDK